MSAAPCLPRFVSCALGCLRPACLARDFCAHLRAASTQMGELTRKGQSRQSARDGWALQVTAKALVLSGVAASRVPEGQGWRCFKGLFKAVCLPEQKALLQALLGLANLESSMGRTGQQERWRGLRAG